MALLRGELVVSNGCLQVIRQADGEHLQIMWPAGYGWRVANGVVQIEDETGSVVAAAGDIVSMAGGEGPVEPDRDACLLAE